MCQICTDSEMLNNVQASAFTAAGEEKLITVIAGIGKDFNDNLNNNLNQFNNNFNTNCGQLTTAASSAITGVAKELQGILYIAKWATGIGAVGAGLYVIHYAWKRRND